MRVADFDYVLPEELVAQHPAAERARSRMLHLEGASGALADLRFADLPGLVDARDILVLNDTRVIKARVAGRKRSGARIELFVERMLGADEALALIRASHPPRAGTELIVGEGQTVEVLGREDDLFRVRFTGARVDEVLERWGAVPLPPYIAHAPDAADAERYQTVYAAKPGAVAAPTAGLHFDAATLHRLAHKGVRIVKVTLHVGAGTFLPVRVERVEEHRMHRERFEVTQAVVDGIAAARAAGGRVLAVGTTALRALESAALQSAGAHPAAGLRACSGETDLFVHPGFRFRVVDRLLTNFHLPRSSLLMLVAAFAGLDNIRRAYAHAIEQRYRFFSYGDAMLIERAR
ncbi:MAG TPA: tRNA preQ1(34) S-adenosylmethionine ribosyltransferase-isomerase QueA [Burkholderiales bacterium]|nr:tRNA preQ1(34) S-adenosylmethionine ribosyltransferase-isomerase QueA [Burkholderiales bacterium]